MKHASIIVSNSTSENTKPWQKTHWPVCLHTIVKQSKAGRKKRQYPWTNVHVCVNEVKASRRGATASGSRTSGRTACHPVDALRARGVSQRSVIISHCHCTYHLLPSTTHNALRFTLYMCTHFIVYFCGPTPHLHYYWRQKLCWELAWVLGYNYSSLLHSEYGELRWTHEETVVALLRLQRHKEKFVLLIYVSYVSSQTFEEKLKEGTEPHFWTTTQNILSTT